MCVCVGEGRLLVMVWVAYGCVKWVCMGSLGVGWMFECEGGGVCGIVGEWMSEVLIDK